MNPSTAINANTNACAVTHIFADEFGADEGITINALCSGWVRTEISGPNAHLSIGDGVKPRKSS